MLEAYGYPDAQAIASIACLFWHHAITACSYGQDGIDPHPLLIRPSGDQNDIKVLTTRGAEGTPFANRQIFFNDKTLNQQRPFDPRIAMDFVHHYPQLIQRPFINWKKTYTNDNTALFVSADENIKDIAHKATQQTYGALTQCFISKKPYQEPYMHPIKKYLLKAYLVYWRGKYLSKNYWLKRKRTLKRSIAKRLREAHDNPFPCLCPFRRHALKSPAGDNERCCRHVRSSLRP